MRVATEAAAIRMATKINYLLKELLICPIVLSKILICHHFDLLQASPIPIQFYFDIRSLHCLTFLYFPSYNIINSNLRFSARVVFLNPEVGSFAREAKKPPRDLINPREESSLSVGRILLFMLERAERG